jgi:hypothetical protein
VFVLVAQAKTHLVQPETYKHPHPPTPQFFSKATPVFFFSKCLLTWVETISIYPPNYMFVLYFYQCFLRKFAFTFGEYIQ